MYRIGDKVKLAKDCENGSYDDFNDKTLVIVKKYTSSDEHPYYDNCFKGMGMYELEDLNGKEIDYMLYDWELEEVL